MTQPKINTYVNSKYDERKSANICNIVTQNLPIQYRSVRSISELFPLLSDPAYHTDYISIDVEDLESNTSANPFEIVNSLKTLIKCTVRRNCDNGPKPVRRTTLVLGIVAHDTPVEIIKRVMPYVDSLTIRVGGSWTVEDCVKDQEKILSGDLSIPTVISKMLKPKKIENKSKNIHSITLTPRQEQILHLVVSRGASNKVIAKMLNISESTVKLHISSILKKFGARNRTQLAVFSNQNKQVH